MVGASGGSPSPYGEEGSGMNIDMSFSEEDEDWFVGGGGGGGGRSRTDSTTDNDGVHSRGGGSKGGWSGTTPLLPLSEEYASSGGRGEDKDDDDPPTPAGQATSERRERDDGSSSSLSCREMVGGPPPPPRGGGPIAEGWSHLRYERARRREHKRMLQGKLACAVFSHPRPLAQYCLDAYATALGLSEERRLRRMEEEGGGEGGERRDSTVVCDGEDNIDEASSCLAAPRSPMSGRDTLLILGLKVLDSVPLSVLFELVESTCDLSISTALASGRVGTSIAGVVVSSVFDATLLVVDVASRLNPLSIIEFVLSAQRHAVGKTGDALVSGIQSVATGVGSVSNAALNRLSRGGLAVLAGGEAMMMGGSRSNGYGHHRVVVMRKDASAVVVGDNLMDKKLFHRLQKMESVSKLVAYSERVGEDAFSGHAKKRAQRIMHYNVSFRPFTATIQAKSVTGNSHNKNRKASGGKIRHNVSFEGDALNGGGDNSEDNGDGGSVSSHNSSGSAFMRTPTSFPPTPTSRLYYFERGSQFTENVVFLARDQLRVERGVLNHNEQTRAMSKALIEGSRLAVFDAACMGNGVTLSCGQHIATKTGNALYSSSRSMIPVMRNSYVYFEISVSPSTTMATLLVGLSTLEMPLDTLVGAYPGSVGLCSTGQMLSSGQWSSLGLPEDSSFGSGSTVGCLVYLDDNSAYDTSEGPHVTVDVTFNINGGLVPTTSMVQMDGCEPTMSLIVPKSRELFPTVTLHSSGTSVMCRFSAEDMLASSRTEIGALSGVVVYAVDGSVILDESEEDEFLDSTPRDNEFLHSEVAL
ncbi:hypothetical protein ACHAW5_004378 [Stephanodiscus triporus]|uniref:B30.2/SPRY domain-containing protein n=1 Tax=Stephanodiscus triporus TaxID=2934178 RepID=A0ABD3P6G1_9STRA